METLKARRAWNEVFWAMNENNFSPRIPYPANLSFKVDRTIKIFHDKQKLKQKIPCRRFYKEFCTQKMKAKKAMRGQEVSKHRRRKARNQEYH
jgi:hypothetical protein